MGLCPSLFLFDEYFKLCHSEQGKIEQRSIDRREKSSVIAWFAVE
jgi:hypothetical protein